MKGNKYTPFLIIGAAVCVVMLLFSVLTIKGIFETVADIAEAENISQANEQKLSLLKLTASYEEDMKQAVEAMERLIPDEADESGIIRHINSLCSYFGADLQEIRFGKRVVNNNINVIPINLSIKCDYYVFVDLVGRMTALERLIRIDKITISKNEDNLGGLTVSLAGRAFYR